MRPVDSGSLDARRVALLFRHEVRSFLRDRRTIFFAIVLPLILFPLIFWLTRVNEQRQRNRAEETVYRVAVTGPLSSLARELIDLGREPDEKETPAEEPENRGAEPGGGGLALVDADDPRRALEEGGLDVYLVAGETLEGEEASGAPLFRIYRRGNRQESNEAARRLRETLERGRERHRERMLRERGLALDLDRLLPVETKDVAGEGRAAGSLFGRFLTALLVFLMLSGGAAVAVDSLAGEKERGTLETLMTTAATRREIVAAKLLVILAAALTVTLINLANLLAYVSFGLLELPSGLVEALPPARVALLMVLLVPTAALLAAVLLLISGLSRTFREAQLYLMPVQLLSVVPPLVAVLPEVSLRSPIVMVPLANVGVAVREVMTGRIDVPMLALTVLVMTASALGVARLAVAALSSERLVSPTATDEADVKGGRRLLERQLPMLVALLWGLFLLVSLNMPPDTDVRLQLLVNVVLLFGGASLVIARRYRIPLREILWPRRPHPLVWPAVIAGAPAGMVVLTALFQLTSRVLPVPEEMLRALEETLLQEDVPRWQLIPMLALLPGIFEELFFRGIVLHGLRRRMRPALACLASGLLFGLFHTSFWRILPTAALGTILAAVTLATGSLLPAMLWHALHNLTGVLSTEIGLDATAAGVWLPLAALALLAGSLALIRALRDRAPRRLR